MFARHTCTTVLLSAAMMFASRAALFALPAHVGTYTTTITLIPVAFGMVAWACAGCYRGSAAVQYIDFLVDIGR